MNPDSLLERFLRYVAVPTTSVENAGRYPSSQGQLDLGAILVRELQELGLANARQDDNGLVWATLPSNSAHSCPTIALNAHLDTSPETSGTGVKPQVVRNYPGGDLHLPGDPSKIIRVSDNPELAILRGCTLVTTDGTTLLGGDDKAGVAIIMELLAHLHRNPQIVHGPVRALFTCDEEIGRGVEFVNLQELDATAAYTLDGPDANKIDVETFSADLATVSVHGVNIHPSIAKNRMANAIRAAADFVASLPNPMAPETTSGRDGFLHPYHVEGGVALVQIKILLRSFETAELDQQAELLRSLAAQVTGRHPAVRIELDVRCQYRNMREGLKREPRAVRFAELALKRLGRTPELAIIRGGTDGSRLSEMGLPTPNLSSGQHNPHSPLEWVCLDEMVQAGDMLIELLRIWAENPTRDV